MLWSTSQVSGHTQVGLAFVAISLRDHIDVEETRSVEVSGTH